jgi:hypothetical protein
MDQMGRDSPIFGQFPQILQSLGHFVQHLIIYGFSVQDYLGVTLSSCPNVSHLTIQLQMTCGRITMKRLLSLLQEMTRLTRLTVALDFWGFSDNQVVTSQPFLNITHLDIYVSIDYPWESQWEIVTHLPKLTHLLIIVSYDVAVDVVVKLLQFCPLLKVLACMMPHCLYVRPQDALEKVDDYRLVLLDGKNYAHTNIGDWGRAPKGCVGAMFVSEQVVFARDSKYSFSLLT